MGLLQSLAEREIGEIVLTVCVRETEYTSHCPRRRMVGEALSAAKSVMPAAHSHLNGGMGCGYPMA